jgi:Na+/H+ antiporter NhaD/arsenite permease-like protein
MAHAPSPPAPIPHGAPTVGPHGHGPAPGERRRVLAYLGIVTVVLGAALALSTPAARGREVLGIPLDFVPFALTLLGVAMLHRHALLVALGGVAAVAATRLAFTPGFDLGAHLGHEGRVVGNLFGLLVGFALLADHFERSGVPHRIPAFLPKGAAGAFVLLVLVGVLSSFLDNIAAAMIGGVVARIAFAGRVSVGYLAAIVAAANAGGAGSVVGDTTTTMMWINGVPATRVMPAFLAAAVAIAVGGWLGARAQVRLQPLVPASGHATPIDGPRLGIVALLLACTIAGNVLFDLPAAGLWAALLVTVPLRSPDWKQVPAAAKGAVFLVSLVIAASMMPVESLPAPSWPTTLGLGFVSSIFDNIPLTNLAIAQDNYDWALLAYAVGYGGSMVWFGSSAGVAITKEFPEARSVVRWLAEGWPVVLAYVLGFFAFYLILDWNPTPIPR